VCPQLAESTNVAEVHHKHNGFHDALRSTSINPEPQTFLKGDEVSEGALLRSSPDELAKGTLAHNR